MDANKNIVQKIDDWSIQTNIKGITLYYKLSTIAKRKFAFLLAEREKTNTYIFIYIMLKYE